MLLNWAVLKRVKGDNRQPAFWLRQSNIASMLFQARLAHRLFQCGLPEMSFLRGAPLLSPVKRPVLPILLAQQVQALFQSALSAFEPQSSFQLT
jgi:hypothetical protein